MQAVQPNRSALVPVTLHVGSQSFKEEDFDAARIVGEVKRGDQVLHSETVVVHDTDESVSSAKDQVAISIETWAVRNTDYMPD